MFQEGKSLYFSRYRRGNADTDQFFSCFEEVSGLPLEQFKKEWLYRIGYPKVRATTHYDQPAARYHIRLAQDHGPHPVPFHLPLSLALVDRRGADIPGTARVVQLRGAESEIVFENIKEQPAFASMNRDYSFYGTFIHENADSETLAEQARRDPNHYNRIDAMRRLTDVERVRLLNEPDAPVGERWLSLFGEILADGSISASLKSYLLRIDEQPMDRDYLTWYQELVRARERLMTAVSERHRRELLRHFNAIDTYTRGVRGDPKEGIEDRLLKNVLLELLAAEDTPESHRLIVDHFRSATTATDRVAALLALNRSSSSERRGILDETYEGWHGHLSGYANYLRIVASGTRDDVFDMIEHEKRKATFDINQPTWCRALILPMATNNKMVWTGRGILWVADNVIELAPINATTAGRLLNTFQHVRRLKPDLRDKVRAALERILQGVTEDTCPAVHGQARAYFDQQ
jgi:aminopeptidase N